MSTATKEPQQQHGRTFFGQPFELSTLFGVELWERFSFYGMQGILLIYLYYSAAKGGLGVDQSVAAGVVGAYGGSVYLATILGAWIADRLIGAERTLLGSATIVMLGHICLALIPGVPGVAIGLVLIALGSGGLKATATTIVGTLYARDDPKRDAGFSLYYLGVNLGAFFGPLLTGLLQSTIGFHFGFGLAAAGMAAGLVQYVIRRRNLPSSAAEVPNPLPRSRIPVMGGAALVVVVALVVAIVVGAITVGNLPIIVVSVTLVATVGYFVVILTSGIRADERSRVLAFVPLFLASTVFWSLYQQQFTVVTIYTDERLDRSLLGWQMPVSWSQSINPIMIIVLSGVFAAMWTRLGDRQPSTPRQVRARDDHHGRRVPPVPAVRRHRCARHPAARARRDPAGLHDRGAAALAGRPVGRHEARAGAVPDPDGRALLPVRRARHLRLRHPRHPLRPEERGALLPGPRARRGRCRGRAARGRTPGPEADAGCSVSALASGGREAQGRSKEVMRMADSSMNIDAPSTSVGSL